MNEAITPPTPEEVMKEIEAQKICAETLYPLTTASQKRVIGWLDDVFLGAQMTDLGKLRSDYVKLKKLTDETFEKINKELKEKPAQP